MTHFLTTIAQKHENSLVDIQRSIDYHFNDAALLARALIHRSFAAEKNGSPGIDNETLEFLGDAVLGLSISHLLYTTFSAMREGELTRLRAVLVNEGHLAEMARRLELGRYLFLGKGEEASGGRQKASILSSAYEALLGAMFLDGGHEPVKLFIVRQFSPWLEEKRKNMFIADAKTALQELLQDRYNEAPIYAVEKQEGPDHDKLFHVSVRFRKSILGLGSARNKKEAEQRAAAAALADLEKIALQR